MGDRRRIYAVSYTEHNEARVQGENEHAFSIPRQEPCSYVSNIVIFNPSLTSTLRTHNMLFIESSVSDEGVCSVYLLQLTDVRPRQKVLHHTVRLNGYSW